MSKRRRLKLCKWPALLNTSVAGHVAMCSMLAWCHGSCRVPEGCRSLTAPCMLTTARQPTT